MPWHSPLESANGAAFGRGGEMNQALHLQKNFAPASATVRGVVSAGPLGYPPHGPQGALPQNDDPYAAPDTGRPQ
jgi:hypothetical protein